MKLNLVQLIGGGKDKKVIVFQNGKVVEQSMAWMFEPGGMRKIAEYADGIGPHFSMIVKKESTRGHLVITDMLSEAHDAGMVVHPYTFRAETGKIPGYARDFEDFLEIFYNEVEIDGVFTDFPDRVIDFLGPCKP
jgi:glycerophosphoryl diester phosphodiesterase